MLVEVVMEGRTVRVGIRAVPWLLAIAALLIALAGSGFVIWPLVLIWFAVLALVWVVGGAMVPTRTARIVAGILLLPVLVLLAFVGGWWLIPADLAWLAIESADRGPRQRSGQMAVGTPGSPQSGIVRSRADR